MRCAFSHIALPSASVLSPSIQRSTMPMSLMLSTTGKMRAACRSWRPSIASMSTPRSAAHSANGRPRYSTSARSPRNLSLKPYGRTAQLSVPTGTTSTHWPSASVSVQLFSGTPVTMLSCVSVQFSPTYAFSTHSLRFCCVHLGFSSVFCTKIDGWGLRSWCIISRWSFTMFCMASIDESSSCDVPKW